jgi:hypothetical protein
MPRPKGSKKEKIQLSSPIQLGTNEDLNCIGRSKKIEYDEEIISINEISGGRVVVNPAVLRYLEQNRGLVITNQCIPMDINEGKDENSQEIIHEQCMEINEFIEDACSTEFLTSVRLAEWILTHQQSAKFQTIS